MSFWQLGNTSVRSAMRIRDGLIAYSQSSIQGDIRRREGDIAFRELLGRSKVVSLGTDQTNSVGRKWRAVMGKLGFLYPEIKKSWGFTQDDLGQLDMITAAGWKLIRAKAVPAIQECFLRSMITPMSSLENGKTFSPLCWTIAILLELERYNEEPSLAFIEMAYIVQTSTPVDGLSDTVDKILELRNKRSAFQHKVKFDRDIFEDAAKELSCSPQTFRDYADMNIRYLKATGMVQAKGKGITLVPEKRTLAIQLVKQITSDKPLLELYRTLCAGSDLPTDDTRVANQVLHDLLQQIKKYNITYPITDKQLDSSSQINNICYEIEELISKKKEEIYAYEQANRWEEITAYMELIASKKDRRKLSEEEEICIPRLEAPAYLEWSLWRALLAINSLVNKPYKVRNFNIDQDFMPVNTAPGRMPDMVAEFADCVIVVEATLSESSRQEAMEGEPVRRHVADLLDKYTKPVFGLFIAVKIDTNTAETFRSGIWYTKNDQLQRLNIVPLTLQQFCSYFKMMFCTKNNTPQMLMSLLEECGNKRDDFDAPQWKQNIDSIVTQRVSMP